jgi:hypothetical protein
MRPVCAVEPQVLELETTGTFVIERAGDENGRCGLTGSPRILAFKVVVASHPSFLNEQGFIIDWQEIHDYFADTFREVAVFPSCERIACQACTDIGTRLGHRCLGLEVTIGSGPTAAGMTAVWRRPRGFTLIWRHLWRPIRSLLAARRAS